MKRAKPAHRAAGRGTVPQPVLILLNGELPDPSFVRSLARKAALIVCTDGGVKHAAKLKIRPHVVLGDMDSLPKKLPAWKGTTYFYDPDEDLSDFEKTLLFAGRLQGMGPFWIAGVLGGRMDHTMVNLALAEEYAKKLPLALVHDSTAWLVGPGSYELGSSKGKTVTLSPVTETCTVTTKGLKYPLKNETIKKGSRGLSNLAESKKIRIKVHKGRIWVVTPQK